MTNEIQDIELYGKEARIEVLPFSCQYEGPDAIIGSTETATFLAVPRGAVEVLEHLASGKTVGEAADLYREQHGELPDVAGFLKVVEAKGIVRRIGADEVQPGPSQPSVKRYHFSSFPQDVAQRIFSRPVIGMCLLVIAAGTLIFFSNRALWPAADNLYFTDHRAQIWTFLVFISYFSVAIHEFAHLISARAIGVNARFGFGHRLYDLVVETDLTGLWSVPKRQRYLPLLAGCLLDATICSLLLFVVYANLHGWITFSSVALRIWRTLLFIYVTRVFWQWFLFVRTDLYYVIATWLNCRNLMGDTEAFLRNLVSYVIPWIHKSDQAGIPAREHRIIPVYALIWIAGRALAIYWLFAFTGRLTIHYIHDLNSSLMVGYRTHSADFWDALLMFLWLGLPIAAGSVLWLRSMSKRFWFSLERNA